MTVDLPPRNTPAALPDGAWLDVLQAVDRTYAELVAYQEQLEQKTAELDALRRFVASVLHSVSDVLLVVDRDLRIAEASRSLYRLLAAAPGSLAGRRLPELFADLDPRPLCEGVAQVMARRAPATIEVHLPSPDGPAPLEFSIAPNVDDRGRSAGAVLTGRPLGELRRAYAELSDSHRALQETQAQLVRNEKLAALGRLLAGVAHELNNPISFVYANTHALEKYASRLEAYFDRVQSGATREELVSLRGDLRLDSTLKNLRTALDGARDGAERVRDIVEDLRRLSSEGSGEMSDFDLAETARVAAQWVERGARSDVVLAFEGAERVMARGRVGHVQQVIMNLVQNAFDALAGRPAPRITITAGKSGKLAFVEVRDNGPGIPIDRAHAIFDPFFTTKDVGKGTGLGLSISHKIAEEHGGALRLCDRQEGGACFRLDLPLAEGAR